MPVWQVLPPLLAELRNETLQALVLPLVLNIIPQQEAQDFMDWTLPSLLPVVASAKVPPAPACGSSGSSAPPGRALLRVMPLRPHGRGAQCTVLQGRSHLTHQAIVLHCGRCWGSRSQCSLSRRTSAASLHSGLARV